MADERRAILTYHSLDDSGSVISVSPATFGRQMDALADSGIRVVPLADVLTSRGPAIALTFDDGFQNFADVAAPILARRGFPATVFLVTGYCGRDNGWPSQWSGVPRLPLMEWTAVRDLARAGIEFGAHTVTHPDLSRLSEAGGREEILSSKQRIEDAIGRPVTAFAYPYGTAPAACRRLVADHFHLGCSTRLGWVTSASSRDALDRLDVYYLSRSYLFRRLFGTPARCYIALRRALREWKS